MRQYSVTVTLDRLGDGVEAQRLDVTIDGMTVPFRAPGATPG